jgi:hypothetical protein
MKKILSFLSIAQSPFCSSETAFLKTLQRRPTTFSFQQKLAFLFRALALLFSNKFTEQLSLET